MLKCKEGQSERINLKTNLEKELSLSSIKVIIVVMAEMAIKYSMLIIDEYLFLIKILHNN